MDRPIVKYFKINFYVKQSGKGERYELAKKKYEMFQNRQNKIKEMDNILTGKQKETIVPKPGEFVVVSTDKKFDPSSELSLGLDDLLESARQTIKSRLESARKSTKRKVVGRGTSQQNLSSHYAKSNPSLQGDDHLLSSISSVTQQCFDKDLQQPQRRFHKGQHQGLSTVKERVMKAHRESQIREHNQEDNESPDFNQNRMNTISDADQQPLSNNQRGLTGSMTSEQYLYSARSRGGQGYGPLQAIDEREQILDKQRTIVNNPDMKTSMTTSIRNIMRKQDKEMLTSSSRLLHSQLEAFDQQMKERQMSFQTMETNQGKTTIELLQNKLQDHQKNHSQHPSMLPSLSKSGLGMQIQHDTSQKSLSRPGSAFVLFGGDKEILRQAKSRINLKESRQRDIIVKQNHSYKPSAQKFQLERVKDASLASNVRAAQLPSLVIHQHSLKQDKDPKSPFLDEQYVEQMVIVEENPRVNHSPVHEMMYKEIEQRAKYRDTTPTRYSFNLEQLKKLRQMNESPQRELVSARSKLSSSKLTSIRQQEKKVQQRTMTEEDNRIARKKFLPIDAYDPLIDTENPVDIIRQYRDKETGKTLAKSKWFFANGESEMRECEVLRYLEQEELYEVKWTTNETVKKVSRFNLIFLKEDEEAFQRRIDEAKHHREEAELIMKYYYMIQNTKIPKFEMTDEQKTRISYFIKSFKSNQNNIKGKKFRDPAEFLSREAKERYDIPVDATKPKPSYTTEVEEIHRDFLISKYNLATLSQLFKELDEDYIKTHKQIYFDQELPYSTDKYNLFSQILPQEKFVPVSERIVTETERKGLIDIPQRSVPFKDLLSAMTAKLHQANQEKLDSLMRVNMNMIKFSPMNFFRLNYRDPQSKELYIKSNRIQAGEVIREVRNCMFDSQYEIHSMIATEAKRIKEINKQRKQAASYQSKQFKEEVIPESFITDMAQFQILLNMLYERSVRQCFENSVFAYIESLNEVMVYMNESISKDLRGEDIDERDILKLATDPVLAKRMEKKFQWKISLHFDKEIGQVTLHPPVEEWLKEMQNIVLYDVEELSFVPCFIANEIGSAREDGKVKIFEKHDDPFVMQTITTIHEIQSYLFKIPKAIHDIIGQYSRILAIDIKKFKQQYKENDYPVERYKDELESNQRAKDHIEKVLFEEKLSCGFFVIKTDKIKKHFMHKIEELNKILFSCVKKKIDGTNGLIEKEVEHILSIINKEPIENIEELTEINDFLNNLGQKMSTIRDLIQDVMSKMALLEDYQYKLMEDEFNRTWISFSRPLEIFRAEFECRRRMKKDEREFFQDLRIMNEKLLKDFDEVKIDFDILQRSEELVEYEDSAIKCDLLLEKLERAIAIAEVANRREGLFKLKKTDFGEIEQLRQSFMPYNTMWNLARDYFYKINTWMNGPLCDIDRDKITTEITDACQTLLKLEKVEFKEKKATGQVCNQLRKLYEKFKPYLPLIIALRNPSLKMRHWENIQKLKTPPLEVDHELHISIQELIEKGAIDIQEEINEISDCASREKKLEDTIQKMKDEWKHIKFELAEFRDSGTHVLKGAEPIWDLLDDHIMKTMTIASSPYIKFLQSEVNYWKHTLIKVQEILEEWTKTQRGWLYLWPIFSSEDIQRQMPLISASFQTVDKIWRNIMLNTFQNPNVLDACLQGRVFENFQQCNDMIDRIQKGLNEYLNTKRMAFPRFFFLSNDDLLHILSQTKDPLRVQDHLNKCFEGIDKLLFDENRRINGMYSSMGEYIQFTNIIDPFNRIPETGQAGDVRNVEDWLTEVETQMRDSLRDLVKRSSSAYSAKNRKNWIFDWPSQIVLTMDQVFWTYSIEHEGISKMKSSPDSMKKVFSQEEQKLSELVELIKVPRSNAVHLLTLGALIVLDVHAKDVTKELALAQVKDLAAFDWISQLRYYVQDEYTKGKDTFALEINVKMVNSNRLYGFEYLGNQTRLVITPLTDRCYRTLMGALQLNLGGAPEGPAGTGKTETTKDLAKAIAKQCIVFNCSDQLNVEGMAKFFKGLACCGAWACFDEFNRIELEVLSVIAQQILTIQTALMRRRPQAPFMFDDEQIPMNPTCAVFITMNPGYAGRSELPDNLKALFRPVAMMIPNYSMIAEISLYSFGFQNARELSIKITQSLRLASEQLSTQSHYDYGMRAVKSIILAAGSLKSEYPNEEESKLVLRAISDCNIPKFITEDIPLFEGIISDLFPTTDKSKPNYDSLLRSIRDVVATNNLSENLEFETKAIQLFETVQVRHGLMMVGAIMSAKTEIIRTLAGALSLYNKNIAQENQAQDYEKVKINTINPKSISIGQLYGDFDKISHDWADGILATVIKDCATDKSGNRRWILMDGPVDAVWIENLNTVLDDNKKLCLSSGEIVKFTPKMTMMFEVEDLLEASPATVSRCGMVYLNPEKLGWQVLLNPWVESLPTSMKNEGRSQTIIELVEYFIPKIMGYTFGYDQTLEEEKRLESLKPVISVTKNWIFRSFLSLFESLMLKNETRDSLWKKEQEQKDREEAKRAYEELQGINRVESKRKQEEKKITPQQKTEIFSLFLMAMTWSFGAPLHTTGRYHLSDFLQEEVQRIFKEPTLLSFGEDLQRKMVLEESGDFFSAFYDCEKQEWLRWDHDLEKFSLLSTQQVEGEDGDLLPQGEQQIEFQSIMIPTEDTIRYQYVLKALSNHSFPVLFIGETGTGKTQAIKTFQTELPKTEWEIGQMVLSATSTAFQVQEYIESKVEKIKKGVYGPKVPGHRMIIFVDDLNMPAKEKYGAQPPIEMLRQVIDNGGFYDLKTNEVIKIVNVMFVSAMGIPGGGRTLPTKRLMRHFNLVHIPPFSNENLQRIFSKILEWGYAKYPDQWQRNIKTIVKLTIALYEKAIQVLLPLPSKSHYLFNLRQVSEIVQGLMMVSQDKVEKTDEKLRLGFLQRLWVHESIRVFSDRLINEDDKILFLKSMKDTIQQVAPNFGIDMDKMQPENIIFNNFIEFNPNDPQYDESISHEKLESTIQEVIEYYNQMNKDKIHLLIFDYVMQHLSRISRIIYKPYGNGLLIGLGGNGRKSLAKLAAFINECVTFKVEISKAYGKNEWQDDLKSMFKQLGMDNKKVVFTFSDSDIKQEFFIEDINNILNVGEVPNLYTPDEIEEIKFEMQKHITRKQGDPYDVFVKRCKKNLHLLLFMSPAGPKLRQYFRQYPSLVNCTSIDWFLSWPEQALQTVSKYFLQQSNLFELRKPTMIKRPKQSSSIQQSPQITGREGENKEENKINLLDQQNHDLQNVGSSGILGAIDEKAEYEEVEDELPPDDKEYNQQIIELQNKVADVLVKIHNSTLNLAQEYLSEKNRQVYITPTRFIEIFKLFENIMKRKHQQIDDERNKYVIGIQKLEEANLMVDSMKEKLEELKPILEAKSKQVEATMIHLDKESKEVEAVKQVVDKEAQAVFEQKEVAEGIKNECQARLSEAQPLLDAALNALRTLNVKDFVTMKSYNSPPYPIKLALEAACIMLGIKPKYLEGPVDKKTKKATKIPDYWEQSKKLLNDYKKFLGSLETYDKDNIGEDRIQKIQEYLQNPKFVPEEIRKASEAAEGICKWVIAICKYDIIAKEIRPKREALGLAQEKLNVVLLQLQAKEAELQKIIDKKNALEEEFKNQNFEKQNLIMQRDECQAKLGRATILMNSLGNEKERWLKTSDRLLKEKQSLLGDMIISTAFMTYLGPFEGSYREKIIRQQWKYIIMKQDILVGEDFSLISSIGVPSYIQQWQLKGLPQDNVSIENIIMIEETKDKWPLIIDPQGQALKFLKDYVDQDFISLKLQQDNYARKLEPALITGATVIVENIGETVDPAVNSIVCREIFEIKGDKYIKFNDNQVEFSDTFRFFMVSNLANPHFSPELQTKTRVLNFSVTKEGLEQQLLSIVCRNESQRDEDERDRLQRQNVEFQEQKRTIEEQILEQLRNSGQDILDDDSLVNSLNESKKITDDIKQKLATSKIIEERIDENRKNYKPVAEHGAKLYFCIQELSVLDPMYQFSMKWYRDLFEKSFTYSEKVKDTKGRVKQLKGDFRKVLYANVCRSIFEQHKMMFAFSMAIKLNEDDGHHDDRGENFGKKLKEFEQLMHQGVPHQALQHSGIQPSGSSHGNQAMSFQRRNTRSILDKKSDSASQAGFNNQIQQLAQKNEEERLRIPKEELRYLLTGLVSPDAEVEERTNPVESFLDAKQWQSILELATLDHFESLPDEIEKNPVQWKRFVQVSNEPVPEPYLNLLPDFAMILLHKTLKPEKTIVMIQKYIEKALGSYFVKPIVYSLEEVFADSKPHIPIILILTPGNDPMEQIKKFGEEKNRVPYPVSLGKGQGEKAKALIQEIRQYGGWVVLQNCHLAESFLPDLEQIIEALQPVTYSKSKHNDDIDPKKEIKPPHVDFRLWLTSMSTDTFPFSILQNSIKLTSEPPKGIKPSLLRQFIQIESSKTEKEFFASNTKQDQWKKMFLALTFFHGIVRERRRYGSLGWNLKYDFNDSDFRISMRQLHLMIDTFDQVPFTALLYLTGECNYGGRVTDDWDRRTLNTILKDFYNRKVLRTKYEFVPGQTEYYIKQEGEFEEYFEYIRNLPDEEGPQLVGLNQNANITQAINESYQLLTDILNISKNSGSEGGAQAATQNMQAMKMAREILAQIRDPFKIKEVEKKFPFKYEESMNSVLLQELARFNNLIEVIKSSLEILIKTLDGKLVMTPEIERMLKSIINNAVPDNWKARSYPSRKPLMSYIKDFLKRIQMLEDWIANGQPNVFWISGFYFTQSFLTGVKQNFARKYKYPIDKVTFTFEVLNYETEIHAQPENGCYCQGLFLEGAGWNNKDRILEESQPKQLYQEMPVIHFLPVLEKEVSLDKQPEQKKKPKDDQSDEDSEESEKEKVLISYQCPVYKTSSRAGTLSTTGHSTNYILTTQLPTYESEDIWVKRSVALLSQLDD